MDMLVLILVSIAVGFWLGYRVGKHSGRMEAYRSVQDAFKRSEP